MPEGSPHPHHHLPCSPALAPSFQGSALIHHRQCLPGLWVPSPWTERQSAWAGRLSLLSGLVGQPWLGTPETGQKGETGLAWERAGTTEEAWERKEAVGMQAQSCVCFRRRVSRLGARGHGMGKCQLHPPLDRLWDQDWTPQACTRGQVQQLADDGWYCSLVWPVSPAPSRE